MTEELQRFTALEMLGQPEDQEILTKAEYREESNTWKLTAAIQSEEGDLYYQWWIFTDNEIKDYRKKLEYDQSTNTAG